MDVCSRVYTLIWFEQMVTRLISGSSSVVVKWHLKERIAAVAGFTLAL